MLATGSPAPHFQLESLDGSLVSLAALRGQVVLITFWSAECPWSARADQALGEWTRREPAAQGLAEPQLVLIAIASNAGEPFEVLRRAAGERGVPILLLDPRGEVAGRYGAQTTPHCFAVDSEGILRYQGAFDDVTFRQRVPTRQYAIEAIEALLAGHPVARSETPPYGCTITRFTKE